MKRHDSLILLTHDHHHALAQVRALRLAATRGGEDRLRQSGEFLDFFETETRDHFREEEEVVLIERILTVEALDAISLHSRKRSDPLHGNGQE